jgi:hypothetical protein
MDQTTAIAEKDNATIQKLSTEQAMIWNLLRPGCTVPSTFEHSRRDHPADNTQVLAS